MPSSMGALPTFHAISEAKPRGKLQRAAFADLFPGVPANAFTLHSEVYCNGGTARPDDVVSVMHEGHMKVGQLAQTVGITNGAQRTLVSLVYVWEPMSDDPSTDEDLYFANYKPSKRTLIKINAEDSLDTVFIYRMADDRSSCLVCLPYECRRRRV